MFRSRPRRSPSRLVRLCSVTVVAVWALTAFMPLAGAPRDSVENAALRESAARDVGESPTPGAGFTNPSAGYRWSRLTITAGVSNLFDRFYVDALSYQRDPFRTGTRVPEPGRQWFANLAWRF